MDDWYASAIGICALRAQRTLLRCSLPPRRRAGCSLLEINCGDGFFLRLLGKCGFDVTATDPNPHQRAAAAAVEPHVEILPASGDCLPFENDSFDHALLHITVNEVNNLDACLQEAFRVAKAGLSVTFWNTFSLPYLQYRLHGAHPPWPDKPCNWWRIWHKLKALHAGHVCAVGTLACPEGLWHCDRAAVLCNTLRLCPPLGGWSIIFLDMQPPRPVTPLPLRLEHQCLKQPEPVLEFEDCGHMHTT